MMDQKQKNKNTKKRLKPLSKMMITFVVFMLLVVFLRAAGDFLIVSSDLEYANAIVVLSGGDESRMQEALDLYYQNYSGLIILTETGEQVEGYEHLHSFDMRIGLLNNGVPSGNIVLTEQVVTSTEDEAQAVKQILQNRQFISCIVVTDPYHTRRTMRIFQAVFADTDIKIIIRPTSNHWYKADDWFLKISGWKFTVLEYIKYFAYQMEH